MDLNMEIVEPRSDDELKPCPFCGCNEIVYGKYQSAAGERWMVCCCGCMASIDPGYAQEQYQVQEKWNRRADIAPERRI